MKRNIKSFIRKIILMHSSHNLSNPIYGKPVSDSFIGLIEYNLGRWNFNLLRSKQIDINHDSKVIFFVLESPHIDEYDANGNPIGPLINSKKFEKFICDILSANNLIQKNMNYHCYIVNTIQLQCSLGYPTQYYRDYVFLYYWELKYKDFKQRLCRAIKKYKPFLIVNCCTKGNHKYINSFYDSQTSTNLQLPKTMCKTFLNNILSKKTDKTSLNGLVDLEIAKITKKSNIKVMKGPHPCMWNKRTKFK